MRKFYLDGLRGWASVIVLINHIFPNFLYSTAELPSVFAVIFQPQASLAFLMNLALACWSILYLFLTNGELAVKVFFVLSGVVLSIRFFETGDRRGLFRMAVCRYARLTIPILASCLLAYFLMIGGLYANQEFGALIGNTWIVNFNSFDPSLFDVFKFALYDVYFHYETATSYNFALWTMSVELFGSFALFVVLLALPRSSQRFVIYAGLIFGLSLVSRNLMCFALGIAIADIRTNTRYLSDRAMPTGILCISLGAIVVSPLILTKIGSSASDVLRALLAAAIVIIVLIDSRLQKALETKLSRVVGDLSFPLYLVHPVMLCSVVSIIGMNVYAIFEQNVAAALTATAAVVVCFCAAIAFSPVEAIAIRASRAFSRLIPRTQASR